jgi:hypothetical protein
MIIKGTTSKNSSSYLGKLEAGKHRDRHRLVLDILCPACESIASAEGGEGDVGAVDGEVRQMAEEIDHALDGLKVRIQDPKTKMKSKTFLFTPRVRRRPSRLF